MDKKSLEISKPRTFRAILKLESEGVYLKQSKLPSATTSHSTFTQAPRGEKKVARERGK